VSVSPRLPLDQDASRVYRRLLSYAKPHWAKFAVGVIGMIMFAASDALMAWLVKVFLEGAFENPHPDILVLVPTGVLVLFLFRGIGDFVANYFPGWVGREVIKTLRGELFAHYLRLPSLYFDTQASGPLLSKLTYNIELVAEATTNALTVMIRDTLTIFALITVVVYLNWRLALFSFTVAPLIAWLIRVASRTFRRYSTRIQNSMGDVTRVAKEAIDGQRLIKVFNAQQHERSEFDRVNEQNRHNHVRLIMAKSVSNPVVQFIAAIGLAGVMYVAIRQVLAEQLRVSEFMAFLTALLMMTQPLRRLVHIAGPLQQGIAAGGSVFELLDQPPEDEGGTLRLARARGEVEFREATFGYATEKGAVLRDVSFHVPAGRNVAIVGRSGSGKSTLVSLLPRFYDLQSGAVLLDGNDVREYQLKDLRNQISLVSQEVVLFNDTIRSNIAFGLASATPADIEAAARAAHLMEFVAELPDGLETIVGDRGLLLSGGQRQRISIARALLRNTPVLILDEATSALDTESERHIQQAILQLMQDRTTLVIAHRLSTIEHADRILVLNDGELVESGTHAQLMARNGQYAALHRMQFNV
jgi:ATP-binding cassette, subfamily B, bacterial MsbA